MNEPVVGRWYLNVAMPLHTWQRMHVLRVSGDMVRLTDDPRPLDGEKMHVVDWHIQAFRIFFRACEDMSKSHVLDPCPNTCPTCFHPRIKLVVRRVLHEFEREAAKQKALQDLRRRVARRLRQQVATPIMDQVIQRRKAR